MVAIDPYSVGELFGIVVVSYAVVSIVCIMMAVYAYMQRLWYDVAVWFGGGVVMLVWISLDARIGTVLFFDGLVMGGAAGVLVQQLREVMRGSED